MSEIKIHSGVPLSNLAPIGEGVESSPLKQALEKNKKPFSLRSDGSQKGLEDRVKTIRDEKTMPIKTEQCSLSGWGNSGGSCTWTGWGD